jgi:hypothetical protein
MANSSKSYQTTVDQDSNSSNSSNSSLFASIQPQDIGLTLPYSGFVSLASAIIALPPFLPVTGGELNKTPHGGALYYTYDPFTGLHVQASPGFLCTGTGNGGFALNVTTDGQWALKFDNSDTILGSGISQPVPPPPAGNTTVDVGSFYDASAGHITTQGGTGFDTITGGVGDYMIGGCGTGGGGAGGDGNCAYFTSGASATYGSILVDMQDGLGYGGNAEGNVFVNMNQVRGSAFTNIEIGSASGTDLKSGGSGSLLISTGGTGHELRADGSGNVLVSTVGADFINFDPNHGWAYGDDNIVLGFGHGDTINLGQIVAYDTLGKQGYNSASDFSNFFTKAAAGYNAATGNGNISDYVKFVDEADGDHLLYSPTGQVQSGVNTTEILDLKLTHGLSAANLYQTGHLLMATPSAYA